MQKIPLKTMFAPPERASNEEIKRLFRQLMDIPFISQLLNAVPSGIMVLNPERQIVFANSNILNLTGLSQAGTIMGMRPGEALQCIRSSEMPAGCGTSKFCETCGAVKAILASQNGESKIEECRMIRKQNVEALDLRVWATPLRVGNQPLTIFALMDISDEKRRKVFERIFFHDILNTASGIKGFAELIKDAGADEMRQYQNLIFALSRMIVDEINSQRTLAAAENHELTVTPVVIRSLDMLREITGLYQYHDVANQRYLHLDAKARDVELKTDRALLQRVIGNMVKNALEAANPGETVTMGCAMQANQVEFWVHNPHEMPREVQLQVFQRSFSTKGHGRGLGTYSIKLLSESYLKGKVSFTSDTEGTVFRASYPLNIEAS